MRTCRADSGSTSHSTDVDDLHTAVQGTMLRGRVREQPLVGSGALEVDPAAAGKRLLQYFGDTGGALAGQVVVVAEGQRLDRLIVGVADDRHVARHLEDRRRDA